MYVPPATLFHLIRWNFSYFVVDNFVNSSLTYRCYFLSPAISLVVYFVSLIFLSYFLTCFLVHITAKVTAIAVLCMV